MMHALSVRQPFAQQIVGGIKLVENRPRPIELRGRIAIHAGLKPHALAAPAVVQAIRDGKLATGAIIGTVQVVGCHEAAGPDCTCPRGSSAAFVGDWYGMEAPIWHWVLAGGREFVTPIPRVKGALGLWKPSLSVEYLIERAEVLS